MSHISRHIFAKKYKNFLRFDQISCGEVRESQGKLSGNVRESQRIQITLTVGNPDALIAPYTVIRLAMPVKPSSERLVNCHSYCRVPEGQGLHKTARPPGHDETRFVNPLVRTQVDKL